MKVKIVYRERENNEIEIKNKYKIKERIVIGIFTILSSLLTLIVTSYFENINQENILKNNIALQEENSKLQQQIQNNDIKIKSISYEKEYKLEKLSRLTDEVLEYYSSYQELYNIFNDLNHLNLNTKYANLQEYFTKVKNESVISVFSIKHKIIALEIEESIFPGKATLDFLNSVMVYSNYLYPFTLIDDKAQLSYLLNSNVQELKKILLIITEEKALLLKSINECEKRLLSEDRIN